jgi:hypothetical protein
VSETKTPAAKPTIPASKLATELKVSGHLMSFDAGLYCIFHPPGSTPPDPQTGLPGVRLSLPPGPAFRPEAVTISTFREDGWLGGWNGAALVRVARGPAQVVVTIYQAPNSTSEAPKLQIMRLAEGQPAPAARPAGAPAAPLPVAAPQQAVAAPAPALHAPQETPAGAAAKPESGPAEIVAHIQTRGDVTSTLTDWMGTPGSKNWIEGFSIAPKQKITPADIEYQAVLGRGWLSPWAEGGQFCGSRGMSLPILGLRVRLRGEAAERLECTLTATFVDGTKIGPLDNGEPAQADSLSPLEAFRVEIKPRAPESAAAPKRSGAAVAKAAPVPAAKPQPAAKAPPPKPAVKAPAGKAPPPPAKPPAKRK